MAKDQFKAKTRSVSLTTRFSVLPLVEKDETFLCVDANFNFLAVSKKQLEEYAELALPVIYDKKLNEQARKQAKAFLPSDPKKVEKLIRFLKTKGAEGFEAELKKTLAQ